MEAGTGAGPGCIWHGHVSLSSTGYLPAASNVNSSAEDKISGEAIAIKMVTRIFDKVQLAKRALREITLLRHFSTRGHENITGLIDLDAIHPDFNEMYVLNFISESLSERSVP